MYLLYYCWNVHFRSSPLSNQFCVQYVSLRLAVVFEINIVTFNVGPLLLLEAYLFNKQVLKERWGEVLPVGYLLSSVLLFLSIWVCSFVIGRMFSRFAKTDWKDELVISFAQSLIISVLLVYFM